MNKNSLGVPLEREVGFVQKRSDDERLGRLESMLIAECCGALTGMKPSFQKMFQGVGKVVLSSSMRYGMNSNDGFG